MRTCSSRKRIYVSETLAEDALIDARTRYDFNNGNGPVAVYRCDDCGQFHLTSKGPVNPRLAAVLASGKLKHQKEADHWERKIRGK